MHDVRRRSRGARVAAAILWLGTGVLLVGGSAAGPNDAEYPLDIDMGDRVDPVRPGGQIVYEVEVENFTDEVAPGVVVTEHLPAGTHFVAARREPDWAMLSAVVEAGEVRIPLGDVAPCDQADTARCRDLWIVLGVDGSVSEGTRLTNRVSVESSDERLPPNEATTVTTAGSAAVRAAQIDMGRPGRDRAALRADLARDGLATPLDPPTGTIDLSEGLVLRLGWSGQSPWFDAALSASELECRGSGSGLRRVRCGLRDRRAGKALGIKKLRVLLPGYLAAQRNNASVNLKLAGLALPAPGGTSLRIELEAGEEIFADEIELEARRGGRQLRFRRSQGDP
jgi:uncharacterized repeat protein (TIGR01451 family)